MNAVTLDHFCLRKVGYPVSDAVLEFEIVHRHNLSTLRINSLGPWVICGNCQGGTS